MSVGAVALAGLFSVALPSLVTVAGSPAGPPPCPIQGSKVVTVFKIELIFPFTGSGLYPSVVKGFVYLLTSCSV